MPVASRWQACAGESSLRDSTLEEYAEDESAEESCGYEIVVATSSPIQQAHYLMGGEPLLLAFIVVIIGGLGSLPGTVVAAVLIGMSDGIISVFFSPMIAKIIATLFVTMILIWRPQGLFGKVIR